MRKLLSRLRLMNALTLALVVGMFLAGGHSVPVTLAEQPPAIAGAILSPLGLSTLHGILDSAHNADLRWPDFSFCWDTELTQQHSPPPNTGYASITLIPANGWTSSIVAAIATSPKHWRSSTTICGIIVLETSATSILDCSTCSMI